MHGSSSVRYNEYVGNGDGWVRCALGHRHWGRYGACGLLLADATGTSVVLQYRAAGTHVGSTWGVPGGARDSDEDYVSAALREAAEEAGIAPASVAPAGWHRVDHGGWSYTTVLARALGTVRPRAANWESEQMRWTPVADVAALPLHPGFAAAWPALHRLAEPLSIVLDVAQLVVDGVGSTRQQVAEDATAVATAGISGLDEPAASGATLERRLPRVALVGGGPGLLAGELAVADDARSWPRRQLRVVGEQAALIDVVAEARSAGHSVLVVGGDCAKNADADAGNRTSGQGGVAVRDPSWWRRQVTAARAWRGPDAGRR